MYKSDGVFQQHANSHHSLFILKLFFQQSTWSYTQNVMLPEEVSCSIGVLMEGLVDVPDESSQVYSV